MLGLDLSRFPDKLTQLLRINEDDSLDIEERVEVLLDYMDELNRDFVMLPLCLGKQAFPEDLMLSSTENMESLIPVIEVALSSDVASDNQYESMLQWVNHVNYHAVVLRPLDDTDFMEFARVCLLALNVLKWTHVWVDLHSALESDPYHVWSLIKAVCLERDERLHAILSVRSEENPNLLARWKGERVTCIQLAKSSWIVGGNGGLPALSQNVEPFLGFMVNRGVHAIVPGHHESGNDIYATHVNLVQQKYNDILGDEEAAKYRDLLQTPMQPLKDNLDSHAYTTFKKDPVKYNLYRTAFAKHLQKRLLNEKVKVVIIGPGERGPLIECCLQVVKELQCYQKVEIFAIEKNINALVVLNQHSRKSDLWLDYTEKSGHPVRIIQEDARFWTPSFYIDILISELLGSFGDNELSPECLEPLMKFLNPKGGVSIPSWSKSYIVPISSSLLHKKVAENKYYFEKKTFDIPYVVYLDRVHDYLFAPSMVWNFVHKFEFSNSSDQIASPSFQLNDIPNDNNVFIHGLAGYFEAALYEDEKSKIVLSTLPSTHSGGHSWFPMMFPFETPLCIEGGQSIDILMRRKLDRYENKIWYEWSASTYDEGKASIPRTVSRIHNFNGHASSMKL